MQSVVYVLYDSIENSVFESQIIQPLVLLCEQNTQLIITLISFEKKKFSQEYLAKKIPASFNFIQCTYVPFFGLWSLYWPIIQLKKCLQKFQSYTLIARGPIAGYIAQKSINNACKKLTVQARGLLAEEYAYTHAKNKNIKKLLHHIRCRWFKRLEHETYKDKKIECPWDIEAVTDALRSFLIHWFDADPNKIIIAINDIPKSISSQFIIKWRHEKRAELHISERARVYCYNGSLKPWQCPEEIISFFKKQLHKDSSSFLLILTPDTKAFEALLQRENLAAYSKVISVPHQEVYAYLAAADIGLLFREKNIMNWVSRPTKALEYRAVGLEIKHNHTVAYLKELDQQANDHSSQEIRKRAAQNSEQTQLT